jgi:glycosyltransferase involved in cell wall biosynthesis
MATVEVVIPVYNEERALPSSIPTLQEFLASDEFPYDWRILIADNASTDTTPEVGARLEAANDGKVKFVRIERKGRGFALKEVWHDSPMDIMSYMDVDLSTGIEAFPNLIRAIADDGYDVAIGSRLARGAEVERSLKRRVLTFAYNSMIKGTFFTRFSDAQCGFKAISREVAEAILPLVEDNNWFFDTELLILAEKAGYKIKDVPVRWIEDTDTTVKIGSTVTEFVSGLIRMRRAQPWKSVKRG